MSTNQRTTETAALPRTLLRKVRESMPKSAAFVCPCGCAGVWRCVAGVRDLNGAQVTVWLMNL